MLLTCVRLLAVFCVVCFANGVRGDVGENESSAPTADLEQTAEAIALDDQLSREMDDYQKRYREFRRSLRSKHPKGEDRIAALEEWQKDHSAWNKDWDRRKAYLESIWNWGPDGKPVPPEHKEDLTTAQGRVAAAIRTIRKESKGSGKTGDRIERWMKENRQLVEEAEAERQVPPAPVDNRQATGTAEEQELYHARKELQRIRRALLAQGGEALKEAMNNPNSEYVQQKERCHKLHEKIEQSQRNNQTPDQ